MKESLVTVEPDRDSQLNTASIAALVERCYSIGNVCRVTEIVSGPGSSVWQVESADSRGPRVFCLKGHKSKSLERIRLEHDLIESFKRQRFHLAPSAIPLTDGDTAFSESEGHFSLYEFVESDPPFDWTGHGWSDFHAEEAGKALADFHEAGFSVLKDLTNEQRASLSADDGTLAALKANRDFGSWDCLSTEFKVILEKVAERALKEAESVSEQRGILIHGDFHPGNVLFLKGQIVAVLDLDYCRIGRRSFDIAYAMVAFGLDNSCGRFEQSRSEKFLASYHEMALSLPLLRRQPQPVPAVLRQEMSLAAWLIALWIINQGATDMSMRARLGPALDSTVSALTVCRD